MVHADRLALLKEHLYDPAPRSWAEPFHEAWMAAEGKEARVRLATAQAAEMAAAVPFIKPGELILGNDALCPVVTGRYGAFAYGIRYDEERLAQVRGQYPEAAGLLDEIATYWPAWFRDTGYTHPMQMHASLGYELFLEHGISGMRERVLHWGQVNLRRTPDCGP